MYCIFRAITSLFLKSFVFSHLFSSYWVHWKLKNISNIPNIPKSTSWFRWWKLMFDTFTLKKYSFSKKAISTRAILRTLQNKLSKKQTNFHSFRQIFNHVFSYYELEVRQSSRLKVCSGPIRSFLSWLQGRHQFLFLLQSSVLLT